MTRSILALSLVASLWSSSYAADELKPIIHEDPALGRPVEFERDVYPILEGNCIACHNVTVSEGDLILESLEAILKGGGNGPAVVPEKPEESGIDDDCNGEIDEDYTAVVSCFLPGVCAAKTPAAWRGR